MSYLLDTNVICELVKSSPSNAVVKWVNSAQTSSLYLSVLTLGEIRKGIAGIQDTKRREKIILWLEHDLPTYFGERILLIDHKISDRWGQLQSDTKKGHILPAIDALIAATALTHQLKLATRNVKDFTHIPLTVINPWDALSD
jgi:predicted nucleic acid-binding protein